MMDSKKGIKKNKEKETTLLSSEILDENLGGSDEDWARIIVPDFDSLSDKIEDSKSKPR